MSDSIITEFKQSPFVQIDFDQLGTKPAVLRIQERPYMGQVNLRGSLTDKAFTSAVQQVLGTPLPTDNNTFTSTVGLSVLWYGPDEWMVLAPDEHQAISLVAALRAASQGVFCSVNDVSSGNAVLDITGTAARDLLVKGCPLDLHTSVFSAGQCAQTLLGKTAVTLVQYDDAPCYWLVVRRSFSDYLGLWLLDAAQEFVHSTNRL